MDAGDIFNRGASIKRVLNLTDTDSEVAINLNNLSEIVCTVFHSVTLRVLGTYKLSEGTVTILDGPNGQLRFIIPQSVSALAKLGVYYCNVQTSKTDVNYESNTEINEDTINLFKLIYG